MEIKIYTEQEKQFLIKALELLEVEYVIEKVEDSISYDLFKLIGKLDSDTRIMIKQLMRYNYEKNFN